MRRRAKDPNENISVAAMRDSALEFLVAQYRDAQRYAAELRRAIDSFSGSLPPDSPYRYVSRNATGSILAWLERSQTPQTIPQLISELRAGGFFMGVIKGDEEIVSKSVRSSIKTGKLAWMDTRQTLVGLPAWTPTSQKKPGKKP